MTDNKQDYNPMEAFRQAQEKQKGLASPFKAKTKPPDDQNENTDALSERETEAGLQPAQEPNSEATSKPISEDGYGEVEPEAQNSINTDFQPKGKQGFETASNPAFEQPPKQGQGSTLGKVRGTTSKVLVNKGDRLQATTSILLFDWRGEKGLQQAQRDRDKLIAKATTGQALDEQEQTTLKYAQNYILRHEERKTNFESQINLSDDDKEELIELLSLYFEEHGGQPSPLLLIAMIVGVTLFSNLYTAFTCHPSYNPPLA